MKNTSIWFYLPTVFILIFSYIIMSDGETVFWEGDKNYILIFLFLCAIAIPIFVRMKKLDQGKKEYHWVHYALLGVWIIFFSLTLF